MDTVDDIKTVELQIPDPKETGLNFDPRLLVTWQDGHQNYLPNDPRNKHYRLAKQWYEQQKKKPFEYDFSE